MSVTPLLLDTLKVRTYVKPNGLKLEPMDVDALGKPPIGSLVPIGGVDPRTMEAWSDWAYLPDALPAIPVLSTAATAAAAKAAMAIARLDEAVAQLPRPEILVRPIIRREAASTSALEGTYATFQEVLEADSSKTARCPTNSARSETMWKLPSWPSRTSLNGG